MSPIFNPSFSQVSENRMNAPLSRKRSISSLPLVRRVACLLAGLGVLLIAATHTQADTLTWNLAGGGAWDTTTANWSPGPVTFTNGGFDAVIFNNAAGGTINLVGNMEPTSTTISAPSGTYSFTGGSIIGAGGLTKSGAGTLAIASNYSGLAYTGTTQIDGGILQIAHNSGGGDPSDRSLGGPVVLNGGTLRFQHTGAGHFNPTLTFTNSIQVTSAGGTIDFNGGSNNFTNTLGPLTLGGHLSVTGNTGSPNGVGAV